MTRVGWLDASGGVSGDMLLGACLDAGASLVAVRAALAALALPEPVSVDVEPAQRGGLGATRAVVRVAETSRPRRPADVLAVLSPLDAPLRTAAARVFETLAAAEARVHRVAVEDVHFHEVGALDAIVDVVGVVAALGSLGLDRLVAGPVAVGGGRTTSEHGPIPVPGPAVLELLQTAGAPAFGGPVDVELATPTGVALLVTLADGFGPLPPLTVTAVGSGAGGRDPVGHANLTRLVIGSAADDGLAAAPAPALEPALVLEANVDDLDPRLWPGVLADLLAAGASDAWLTPILMKKGRPAHTVSVLAPPVLIDALERLVVTRTSTIGVRRHPVTKRALDRTVVTVDVLGEPVRVKLAYLDGAVTSAEPEFDDVAALAAKLAVPARTVLAVARSAALPPAARD